jgi:signal peptidase II
VSDARSGPSYFWLSAAVAAALDQLTKHVVYDRVTDSREIIPGVFYLTSDQNKGVVWGLFNGWPFAVFVVGILAAAFVVYYYHRHSGGSRLEATAWGLILGGAIGNLIDRGTVGHVKDFISVRIAGWPWPTFNIADACITVGAFIIIWFFLFTKAEEKAK